MPEYISREAARPDAFCEGVSCQDCPFCKDPIRGGCRIDDFVKSIPAANVVEVVRCTDCEYFSEPGWCENPNTFAILTRGNTSPNWFCADGKRKDGGQDDE